MFTSIEVIKETFQEITGGDILNWIGHRFFWKRNEDEGLKLLATSSEGAETENDLKEICQFEAPKIWRGCGRWVMDWPKSNENEEDEAGSEILIRIYLYSEDPKKLNSLVSSNEEAAFLAAYYLSGENAQRFYTRAENNYESLQ